VVDVPFAKLAIFFMTFKTWKEDFYKMILVLNRHLHVAGEISSWSRKLVNTEKEEVDTERGTLGGRQNNFIYSKYRR